MVRPIRTFLDSGVLIAAFKGAPHLREVFFARAEFATDLTAIFNPGEKEGANRIVGAYAVIYHAQSRHSKDTEFFIKGDAAQKPSGRHIVCRHDNLERGGPK